MARGDLYFEFLPLLQLSSRALHCNSLSFSLAVIKNFMEDVMWGDIDYLIIDTPPGTSDEHISTIEHLAAYTPDGAVLVTTPQVRKQSKATALLRHK